MAKWLIMCSVNSQNLCKSFALHFGDLVNVRILIFGRSCYTGQMSILPQCQSTQGNKCGFPSMISARISGYFLTRVPERVMKRVPVLSLYYVSNVGLYNTGTLPPPLQGGNAHDQYYTISYYIHNFITKSHKAETACDVNVRHTVILQPTR